MHSMVFGNLFTIKTQKYVKKLGINLHKVITEQYNISKEVDEL